MRITIETDSPVSVSRPDQTEASVAAAVSFFDGGSAPGALDIAGTPGAGSLLTVDAGPPSDELVAAIAAAPSPSATPQGVDGGSAPSR